MTKEILDRLDLLGAKLGVTGAHAYEVLVRQAHIDAWSLTVLAVLLWVVSGYCFNLGRRYATMEERDQRDSVVTTAMVSFIVSGFLLIIGTLVAFHAAGRLLNPEYYAIQEIMEAIRQ